jgi:hypothetical protein
MRCWGWQKAFLVNDRNFPREQATYGIHQTIALPVFQPFYFFLPSPFPPRARKPFPLARPQSLLLFSLECHVIF